MHTNTAPGSAAVRASVPNAAIAILADSQEQEQAKKGDGGRLKVATKQGNIGCETVLQAKVAEMLWFDDLYLMLAHDVQASSTS